MNDVFNGPKTKVKFDGGCLKQEKTIFHRENTVYVHIIYEIKIWQNDLDSEFTSLNSLFGVVKLTKNSDPDKYSYSRYGIGFDARGTFPLSAGNGFGKNVTIFGVENSPSVHANLKKKIYQFLVIVKQMD